MAAHYGPFRVIRWTRTDGQVICIPIGDTTVSSVKDYAEYPSVPVQQRPVKHETAFEPFTAERQRGE